MQPAAGFLRDKLLEGKGKVTLNQSETLVLKQFQREAGTLPIMYGSVAFGFNYIIVNRLMANNGVRWVRLPLNLLAFGIGASYGLNSATNNLVVNFYSLPDSPIAAEGREWLKKNDPNNPVLGMAVRRLSRQNSRLGSTSSSGGLLTPSPPAGSPSLDTSLNGFSSSSNQSSGELTIEEPGMDQLNLVSLGDIGQGKTNPASNNNKDLSSSNANSKFGLSKAPSRTSENKSQSQNFGSGDSNVGFHGEDAFSSSTWDEDGLDPNGTKKKAGNFKQPRKHDSKGERTWDEVRAEWLKAQVDNATKGSSSKF